MFKVTVCLVILALVLKETRGSRYITLDSGLTIDTKLCKYQICNQGKNYPEHEIEEAMEQHHTLKSLLKDDPLLNTSSIEIFSIKGRVGVKTVVAQPLCNVDGPTTKKPLAMRNLKNEWKTIVNTDKYHQTFTVETCRELASIERKLEGNRNYCTQFGFQCKQNPQILSLLIYEKEQIRFDRFVIPTNCKCCAGTT